MSRKIKIFIVIGIAAVLLIVGIAIPVMAQDTPTPTPPVAITKQAGILDRVAQLVGKSREQVVSAVKQAAHSGP